MARHYRAAKFNDFPLDKVKESFIQGLNQKGYVPINVKVIPEQDYEDESSIKTFRYGMVYATCIYFGKRNAIKIKELEQPLTNKYEYRKN